MKVARTLCVLFAAFSMTSVALGQSPIFTKSLTEVNGVPVSGTPASVTNGDVLRWVMTYQLPPGGAVAEANITDLLPPALQYVAGSLQAPPSWDKQWYDSSSSSWVLAQPPNATGAGARILFPHITPFGAGQTALVPAPATGSISTSGSGGDGYHAISYNNKIYVLNHHTNGKYLDCFDASTGLRCANYPAHVPLTPGSYVGNNNQDNTTPYKSYEYLDRNTGKMYFAVQKTASPFPVGVLCADLLSLQSCGFTTLMTLPSVNSQHFEGVGAVNGKVYVQLPNGTFGCFDSVANAACGGQPFPLLPIGNVDQVVGSSEIAGNNIYTLWQTGPAAPFKLTCFDAGNSAPCMGAWPQTPDTTGSVGLLYPLLNAGGAVTGVCTLTTVSFGASLNKFACYGLNGVTVLPSGSALPNPTNYAAFAQQFNGAFAQSLGLGQNARYGARVFNGHSGAIGCYDFAAAVPGPCVGSFPVTGANITSRYYATVTDPERPGCLWSYGDDGVLGSFQASDGRPCSGSTLLDTTVKPADSYCATRGDVSGWGNLSLFGLSIGGGITASLTIYDGNNPTQLAVKSDGVTPYAQNLPITSFPLILGAGGLGIGYGGGTGNYTSLRFVIVFSGVTNHAPWSQSPPPNVEVSWIGGPPEICFQTIVATCENAKVTNQATAVTTPLNGAPLTQTAPNPPFSTVHNTGADCKAKLIVKKTVAGPPPGFTGTFKFNVTCATQTGVVQQQLTIVWPNTTVTLTGLTAPATCSVAEDLTLPPPPPGYSWDGLPVANPASGVVQVTVGGTNQVSFTNTMRRCPDLGKIKITKLISNPPAGFTGTFTFNVACWTNGTLTTQTVQVNYPGQPSVIVNAIPMGSSCTVTEASPLPPLPPGWFWQPPVTSPASGQVSLTDNCCPEITFTNRPKFCCFESDYIDK